MATTLEQSKILGKAFEQVIVKHYGSKIAPEALITPTGIKSLDALLGGGIVSSGPVILSSTPESGKSTIAYQLSKIFQDTYDNSVIVYLDIEGSGNSTTSDKYKISRIDGFGLDKNRFRYEPILLNVMELFDLIEKLIEVKKAVEEKTKKEFYVMIVWDSIPSTPSSKTEASTEVNQTIGIKARQLSYCLDKYNPMLKFNKITYLCIDQVRANIQIEMFAAKEQSVGNFKDMKSASNIFSLQHATQQWLFFSKSIAINESEGLYDRHGDIISGWYLNVLMEKNKLTSSKDAITVVFSKRSGIDRFWSEFTFLHAQTPIEKKIYKTGKMPFPLLIKKSGTRVLLDVVDPANNKSLYKSEPFYRKKCREMYDNDPEFHKWFDYAVDISCQYRIIKLKESIVSGEIEIDLENQDMTALEPVSEIGQLPDPEQLSQQQPEQLSQSTISVPEPEVTSIPEPDPEDYQQTIPEPDVYQQTTPVSEQIIPESGIEELADIKVEDKLEISESAKIF